MRHECRRRGRWAEDPEAMGWARGDFARAGRHGRRRGGGLRRFFAHGDLRFLILKLIEEKPRHGYDLIKEIEDRLAGAYAPSPGVIYPTLTLLEDLGWVDRTDADGGRKLYTITPEGTSSLEANRATVEAILGRMAEVRLAKQGDTPAAVADALSALNRAIILRLSQADAPEGVDVDAIVLALGRAARDIAGDGAA